MKDGKGAGDLLLKMLDKTEETRIKVPQMKVRREGEGGGGERERERDGREGRAECWLGQRREARREVKRR